MIDHLLGTTRAVRRKPDLDRQGVQDRLAVFFREAYLDHWGAPLS